MYCGDPAKIIKKLKQTHWPFKTENTLAFCYECHMEVFKNQLPKVTDSHLSSRRGSGIKKRRRLIDD
jgi:hypothetical protein